MKSCQRSHEMLQVSHSFAQPPLIDYKRDGHQAGDKNRGQQDVNEDAGTEECSHGAGQLPVACPETSQDNEGEQQEQSQACAYQRNLQTNPAAVGDVQS